jgi:ATP-dependent RNA helicase HelY
MQFRGLTLDPFQETAITHLREGRSVLVCAPTGTGKTIVADAVVERALTEGKRVVFTAPIKALSNQKYRDYCRIYGKDKVGLVTGDLVINRDAPCLVMTTEILRNMLLTGEDTSQLMAVVLDEIHFLDDRERGTVWEEVLIYLPSSVQILGLSATLSNVQEFADWLSHVRGSTVEVVEEHQRAVPLEICFSNNHTGVVKPSAFADAYRRWKKDQKSEGGGRRGRGRGRRDGKPKPKRTSHLALFEQLRFDGTPYLYFVFSRKQTEQFAKRLGRKVSRSLLEREDQHRLDERLSQAVEELGAAFPEELENLYRKGIAFHHAGLHVQLKALVEELYEAKLLRVLYTTTTFALGINMPARTVVLDAIKKYDGRGVNPLTVRGFMQKAGRAGRRGMDEHGTVIVKLDFEDYGQSLPSLERYLKGDPEPVRSSFNLSFNSVVNLLDRHGREACRGIVERSFLAFRDVAQSEQMEQEVSRMQHALMSQGWKPEHGKPKDHKLRKQSRQLRQLEARVAESGQRVWNNFEQRRQFLVDVGYLTKDDEQNAGARILRNVQIEELFTTELILDGVLEDLEDEVLFGVLVAMTGSLPRQCFMHHREEPRIFQLAKHITNVRMGDVVTRGEAITGLTTTWTPELIRFGVCWERGEKLEDLKRLYECETDLSGQLVSNFRRAKDMVTQLRQVHLEDEHMATRLKALAKRVSRDEVEVVG